MFQYFKKLVFYGIVVCMAGFYSLAMAEDDRHLTVDRAVGGMEQGSRIGAPGKEPIPITDVHKTITSSQGTKQAGASSATPVTVGENHGYIYTNMGEANPIVGSGPDGFKTETNESQNTQSGESPTEPVNHPVDTQAGTGGTGETSNNPIVDTDVNVNPDSGLPAGQAGTIETDATVDTTGELEEKEIFETDLEVEGVTSVDAETGSASETTEPGSTTGGTQESSEPSSNPIVDADVNVNPESGTVEADATVDTSGELEEKQIVDADLTAGETTSTETEVGSATDVTQSDTIESADITTQPTSTVTTTSDTTAEVDTTGETTTGETDVGIEADASGTSEGEDVTCDPADGLTSSGICGELKL